MDQIERNAATVEEAIDSALTELGISEQEAEIEVLQEPRSGFLGFNSQRAVVRVTRRSGVARQESAGADDLGEPGESAPEGAGSEEETPDALTEEQADVAADFLEGLLEAMGIAAEVEIHSEQGLTYVEIWGSDDAEGMGVLIGKHGNTLDSLQELVRLNVQRTTGERCRVIVDVEDYRKRRRAQLVRRAHELARRVAKSGRPEELEAMTSFDRKIVHDAVTGIEGVATASEGEEPDRHVVIRRL